MLAIAAVGGCSRIGQGPIQPMSSSLAFRPFGRKGPNPPTAIGAVGGTSRPVSRETSQQLRLCSLDLAASSPTGNRSRRRLLHRPAGAGRTQGETQGFSAVRPKTARSSGNLSQINVTARRQDGVLWPKLHKTLLNQQAFVTLWPESTFGFPRSQWPVGARLATTRGINEGFQPSGWNLAGIHPIKDCNRTSRDVLQAGFWENRPVAIALSIGISRHIPLAIGPVGGPSSRFLVKPTNSYCCARRVRRLLRGK